MSILSNTSDTGKGTHPFYGTAQWKKLRSKVGARWRALNLPCGYCHGRLDWSKPGDSVVDHILPRHSHPHLALVISNLRVVHKACNQHVRAPRPPVGLDGWPK